MRPTGSTVTAVVVDDHAFFRDGLSRGLLASGLITVVGEAADGRSALELIMAVEPDVAVVDYQMPVLDGLAVVHAVVRGNLRTRVLLLSAITDGAVVFRALEEGAAGYLGKDARRSEIVDAVLSVAAGKTVVPAELAAGLVDEIRLRATNAGPILSERELQVLAAFARGLSVPQTAAERFIAPSTVKTHTQRLEIGCFGSRSSGCRSNATGTTGIEVRGYRDAARPLSCSGQRSRERRRARWMDRS